MSESNINEESTDEPKPRANIKFIYTAIFI